MAQKKGVLIYRCRRCGNEIKNVTVAHLPIAARSICVTGSVNSLIGRQEFASRPHTCPDGQVGITDVIGGEYSTDQSTSSDKKTSK